MGPGQETDHVRRTRFRDVLTTNEGMIRSRVVVAAAGPWTDEVLRRYGHPEPMIRATKGVHLVFQRERLNVKNVVVVPTADKRMIFVAPRDEFTYVGTTDTDYRDSLESVLVKDADVDYLLDTLNDCFPSLNLGVADIISSWAGLRPLLREEGDPSKVSRDYQIALYEHGLAVIAGGKLTTYRTMAESLIDQVVDRYKHRLQGNVQPCRTAEAALVGGEMADFPSYLRAQSLGLINRWGLSQSTVEHLIKSYGHNHMEILALGLTDHKLLEPLGPDVPIIKAEVVYAVEDEMALTIVDFMGRRTGLMLFDVERGLPVVETVVKIMGKQLGWGRTRRNAEIQKYRQAVQEMFIFRSQS